MSVDTWNQERTDKLIELHKLNISFADIAAKISGQFQVDISRCAAIGKAKRLGLVCPRPEPKVKIPKPPRERKRQGGHHAVYKIVAGGGGSARVIQWVESTETIKLRCIEIVPRRLSLLQLADGDCRYPYDGIEGEDTFVFCGHPKKDGSSFCVSHHHLCFVPATSPNRPARKYFGTDFARGAAA